MKKKYNRTKHTKKLRHKMNIKKLNDNKSNRLKAIYCWLASLEMNNDIIKGYHKVFDYEKFFHKSVTLIPNKYSTNFCLPIQCALLKILRDGTYDKCIKPFLEFINMEYINFNNQNINKRYSFNDDFWISKKLKNKHCWFEN